MDKNRLCYILRSRYPEVLGIRKCLQRGKVRRLYRHFLPKEEIEKCEKNPLKKKEVIQPYLTKWEKYLRPTVAEMEDILTNAPIYKDRKDKDDLRVDMIYCRLAYGFIPSEYVGFGLEHKSPQERKMFVSDIDTNVFGYSVNDITKIQKILDKGDGYYQFKKYFCRDAVVIEHKKDYQIFQEFIRKHPVFVKKVVFSSMGKGIELVNISLIHESQQDYFNRLIKSGKYLLEECVIQHDQMAKFNESSVNTVRCITFRTTQGIEVPYCFMRTGRNGSFVDNGGSGGLLIGIDVETGILNTDGFDEYNEQYPYHPNSGVIFKGSMIPSWNQLLALCKEMASEVQDLGYLSWDLAYAENGWVVIEVNEVGQLIGPQIVMQRGIKTELTQYFARMHKVV
nr:sugar-transfer associated ATP-grasp domain-containing protein [uncultured Faecalicatena sp.]